MKRHIYFSALIIMLVSCEFKLEETNHREIEPPLDYVMMEFNLNDIHPLETINIWERTRFTFSLNAGHRSIHRVEVRIGNHLVSVLDGSTHSSFSFEVDPSMVSSGVHRLQVNCITSSGTRSLADLMGFEGYQLEAYWNINVLDPEVINKTISEGFIGGFRILEGGHLELFWDNPLLPDDVVTYYFVDRVRVTPLQKSVITRSYVCGTRNFTIMTQYRLGSTNLSYTGVIVVDTPIPRIYVEYLGSHMRIYWDKPLAFANARYAVRYVMHGRHEIITGLLDTTVLFPKPTVGTRFECVVEFHINLPGYSQPSARSDTSFIYGEKVGFEFNFFFYNTTENVVYIVSDDSIAVVDPNSLDSRRVKSEIRVSNFISSANSSKIALIGFDAIYVYDNSKLLYPTIFQRQNNSSYALSDEFLFEFNALATNIYDLATTSLVSTHPPMGFDVKMSADGTYFACVSFSGDSPAINIYTFNNLSFSKIITHTIPNYFWDTFFFHPSNPHQIILNIKDSPNYYSRVDIYQLPEFNMLQSTNISSRLFLVENIDPVTDLILYGTNRGSISITVISSLFNLNNHLYTIPVSGYFFLYNGRLFSRNGYAADIRRKLLQP